MTHWLKHYEAWQNIWQPASKIWITGSDINACLTLTNTNCCYRHHYLVQRRRYCDEFETVYVHGSVSGWTVSGPKMKSLYHCQYLSPLTSTHGNYPGTASNPIRAYQEWYISITYEEHRSQYNMLIALFLTQLTSKYRLLIIIPLPIFISADLYSRKLSRHGV